MVYIQSTEQNAHKNHQIAMLRPLLRRLTSSRNILRQPRQRERPIRKMDDEEPGAESIDEVVQAVGVGDAVDRCVEG